MLDSVTLEKKILVELILFYAHNAYKKWVGPRRDQGTSVAKEQRGLWTMADNRQGHKSIYNIYNFSHFILNFITIPLFFIH